MVIRYVGGILLTLIISLLAQYIVKFPLFSTFGSMIIAILLGIFLRNISGNILQHVQEGITFSAYWLLRIGIVLLGARVNFNEIIHAGPKIILLDAIIIFAAIFIIETMGKNFKTPAKLTTLIAVGTGICGAAAIAATAPVIKATNEDITISVTIIAVIGTIFTIAYAIIFPYLGLDFYEYGIYTGATLHEIAHVIAAADPLGPIGSDIAIIVKLARVLLLAPTVLIVSHLFNKKDLAQNNSTKGIFSVIPWFIVGFLIVVTLNSINFINPFMAQLSIDISILFMSMAMAGLGLNVVFKLFLNVGWQPMVVCIVGSIIISVLGKILIHLFNI